MSLSVTYILFVLHILLFSRALCQHTTHYKVLQGSNSNYVAAMVHTDCKTPWNSISHISHIRGSSLNKWHSILMSSGSILGLSVFVIKVYDSTDKQKQQQIIAVYLFLFACIGGILVGHVEAYGSPSFSKHWNLLLAGVHMFGGFLYIIFGNLSYLLYTNMNFISVGLFCFTIVFFAVYYINMGYQYQYSNLTKNDTWVHNVSVFNIGTEVTGIAFSVIAMNLLIYQFANEK